MDPKTKKLVEEAERFAEKATPGPWAIEECRGELTSFANPENPVEIPVSIFDDEFAAFSRDAVPALCAAVRELDKTARHATEEAAAFSKRIDDLEALSKKERRVWCDYVIALTAWQDAGCPERGATKDAVMTRAQTLADIGVKFD